MKNIKRLIALIMAVAMLACLSACHPKGEVAISSGDIEITSAMYSYYLVMADIEAQNKVDENVDTTATGFDYLKQEIDGKSYSDYVKDLALEYCLKDIAYRKLCADKNIELTDEDIVSAQYNAQYNWYYYGYDYGYQYGYNGFLPQNGVSYETYLETVKSNFHGDKYFKHLYDEGGEKAVSKEDIQKALDENYAAAYIIAESYTDDATLKTAKEKLSKYIDRLKAGEEFKKIYDEHNKTEENSSSSSSSTTTSSDTSSTTTSSETSSLTSSGDASSTSSETSHEETAEDKNIVIVGSDKTDATYKFAKFNDIKSMKMEEIKLIEDSDNKTVYMVVKKDINADSYYKENMLKSSILYLLKGDEFEAFLDEYVKGIKYDVNKHAVNQFKIKNIKYDV